MQLIWAWRTFPEDGGLNGSPSLASERSRDAVTEQGRQQTGGTWHCVS